MNAIAPASPGGAAKGGAVSGTPSRAPKPPFWRGLGTGLPAAFFLAPCLIALALVYLYPTLRTFQMSVMSDAMGRSPTFVGLSNYARIFADPTLPRLLTTSVIYTVGNVAAVWAIGLGTALLLNESFRGRSIVRALFIIPWAMPYVAASLIFAWMLGFDTGILNYMLRTLSGGLLEAEFLTACPDALVTLTGISIWKLFPLGTVMMLSALQTIPESHYEAARVDGASSWQCFRYVTLPGIRSTSITLTLLMMIWCFGRSFTAIYLLTGGGPAGCSETIVLRSYTEMFQGFRPGTASALGVGVLVISFVCAAAYLWFVRSMEARR